MRAATTQAKRNKELQKELQGDFQDQLEPRKEQSDPLPTSPGSASGWEQLTRRPPGAPLGKPEHTPRRWDPSSLYKQHPHHVDFILACFMDRRKCHECGWWCMVSCLE